jgi:hypothetical protein
MTDLVTLRNEAINHAQKAVELDNEEKFEEAQKLYILAGEKLKLCAKIDQIDKNKATYTERAKGYLERAIKIKEHIEAKEQKKKPMIEGGGKE